MTYKPHGTQPTALIIGIEGQTRREAAYLLYKIARILEKGEAIGGRILDNEDREVGKWQFNGNDEVKRDL